MPLGKRMAIWVCSVHLAQKVISSVWYFKTTQKRVCEGKLESTVSINNLIKIGFK
jgi:hypothetical protein